MAAERQGSSVDDTRSGCRNTRRCCRCGRRFGYRHRRVADPVVVVVADVVIVVGGC